MSGNPISKSIEAIDKAAEAISSGFGPPPSRDPSTETWREAVGLSTSAQLQQTQQELTLLRDEFEDVYADLAQARYELKQERLLHAQTKKTLAASQQDLTRVEGERDWALEVVEMLRKNEIIRAQVIRERNAERDRLHAELAEAQKPCAWRDLAVTAMRERDVLRAQLDDRED